MKIIFRVFFHWKPSGEQNCFWKVRKECPHWAAMGILFCTPKLVWKSLSAKHKVLRTTTMHVLTRISLLRKHFLSKYGRLVTVSAHQYNYANLSKEPKPTLHFSKYSLAFYSALPYSRKARPAQKWEWHIWSDYEYNSFVAISFFSVVTKKE